MLSRHVIIATYDPESISGVWGSYSGPGALMEEPSACFKMQVLPSLCVCSRLYSTYFTVFYNICLYFSYHFAMLGIVVSQQYFQPSLNMGI